MQALHIGVEFYTIRGTLFSLGYVHAKQTGCPHRAVLSSIPRSAYHCWRAIHAQLDFVLSHALWSIGKGNIFLAWYVVEFSSASRQASSASYLCQRGLQWPQYLMDEILSLLDPISIQSMRGCLSGQTSLATSSWWMPSLFLVHGNRRGLLILLSTGGNMFGINGYTQRQVFLATYA